MQKSEDYLNRVKNYIKGKDIIFISRIQAEFSIGYVEAKEIINQLVEDGVLEVNPDGGYIIK